ncbi:MAG TPA: nuclear transport factor 2 family protein [Thermoanaerobaculia bacterium]|jgi:ketosteroid isomerase-like protein
MIGSPYSRYGLPGLVLLLAVGAALPASQTASPVPGPAAPEEDLRQVDAGRFAAMVAGDTAALKNVLGEDLTYTHSTGEVQDRQHFLDALSAGTLRYESMSPSEVRVRLYGSTGVVTGRLDMKVVLDGGERSLAVRYTAVYVRRDLRWQLVAWQSSSIAPAKRPAR